MSGGGSCDTTHDAGLGLTGAVEGIVQEQKVETADPDGKKKTKTKVLRKIPPEVIGQAKGLAIFTSMRSGIAPFGGAGGAGVVVAKLPDGSESLRPGDVVHF